MIDGPARERAGSHPEAGVTLIEILIAVSLLSLLSIGILIAMRIGFNTMEKVDSRLVSDRRVSYARRIIENEIAGYSYTVASWPIRPDVFQPVPFYQFEPQTMRFVTAYSLADAWRGRLQIAAFQVIPGDQGRGVRLIVNETPYAGPVHAGEMITAVEPGAPVRFVPVLPGPRSFVLADHLSSCRFMYLEALSKPPFQLWRPDWAAPQQLPLGIRIEMTPLNGSPADLHVSTVTVAFNVNRTPGLLYEDKP
jgi:hypothetical protein